MQRGNNMAKATFANHTDVYAAFLGGGAATNLSIPTNGVLTDSAAGLFPRSANLALTGTYVSTGVFTIVLSESCKNILWAQPIVVSDGGSPTAILEATCTKITPPNTLTIKIFTPSGTLTDPGTSDLIIIRITFADTNSINGMAAAG